MAAYILLVGSIRAGLYDWRVTPPAALEAAVTDADIEATINSLFAQVTPADGELQRTIDYAAELQELEDDIEDRAFWARGQW